jgi:hypothetical protein
MKFYPKAYREERGEEIAATLHEVAEDRGLRLSSSDQLSVVRHGLQVRLGLTTETMFGKALDLAAIPGLVMGASFGLYLMFAGDSPVVSSRYFFPRFGPFLTVGPLLYLVWVLGVAANFEWPQFRRRIAGICMALTLTSEIVAKAMYRNPNQWKIAILLSLGLPSLLAPTVSITRRRILPGLAVGFATFALLFLVTRSSVNPGFFNSFYWSGTYEMVWRLPYVDLLLVLLVVTLWLTKRREIASAVVILASPWMVVGVVYPLTLQYLQVNAINVIALAIWAIGIVAIVTTSRYRPQHTFSIEFS